LYLLRLFMTGRVVRTVLVPFWKMTDETMTHQKYIRPAGPGFLLTVLALSVFWAACNGAQPTNDEQAGFEDQQYRTVIDAAMEDGRFTTFLSAVQAAGLEESLRDGGTFTVFAPTDEAFAMLPEGTLEQLMMPENRNQLRTILTYHIADGEHRAADLQADTALNTLEGSLLHVVRVNGSIRLDTARVVESDIAADNGVLHAIDDVLIPPDEPEDPVF
jgi:uncharacterized surface protein with fasciclin (FAS1) repeats